MTDSGVDTVADGVPNEATKQLEEALQIEITSDVDQMVDNLEPRTISPSANTAGDQIKSFHNELNADIKAPQIHSPPADSMSEIGLGDDEEENMTAIPRRNSETEILLNGGRLSRCTIETQSMKSDSDIDLSSDENCTSRQLQLKILSLERQLTEQSTALAEEQERRICDLAHFQKEKNDMLIKQEQLIRELEKMKKDKESAVMKYAKSEHEAITASRSRDSVEKKLIEMTKERDVYIARVRQLNQDYTRMQSRLDARAGDLNKLERVIDRLSEEKAKAIQRFHDLEKYCDKLLADQQQELVKTATEQTTELSEQLEKTKRRLTECQQERDELYQRVNHLEDSHRAHHEHLSLAQMEIERLKAGLEQAVEDHAACGQRDAESLKFVQQLTERTLKDQAENEQLKAQLSLLKEDLDLFRDQNVQLERNLTDISERLRVASNERKCLEIRLAETEKERDVSQRRMRELQHEKAQLRRKGDQNVKQLSKELQIARKKIDEIALTSPNANSEEGSMRNSAKTNGIQSVNGVSGVLQLDQKLLVDRIVHLQKNLARKTEKIEFLEEHAKELMAELNRKKGR